MKTLSLILCCLCSYAPPLLAGSGKLENFPAGSRIPLVFLVICLIIILKIGWCAIAALHAILLPKHTIRGSQLLVRKTFSCATAGVLLVVFLAILIKLLFDFTSPTVYLGVTFVTVTLLFYLCASGFAMASHAIGERIQISTASPTTGSNLHAVLRGGALLILIDLFPIFGSIIMLGVLLTAAGAALVMCFTKQGGAWPQSNREVAS